MKILLLTQLFTPEPVHLWGITFAKRLADQGHHVEVLTGFPNYPGGRVYDGYKIRLIHREMLEGVRVTRVAMYPSHDNSSFRRFLTYVSLPLSAMILGPFLFRRFDIVHVKHGPATLALPGIVLAYRTRAKLILDIQDIWPESVISSGMLRNRLLLWLLEKFVKVTYQFADAIIVLSEGYKRAICSRGVQPRDVHVIFNWSNESIASNTAEIPEPFRRLQRTGKSIILFAGAMGRVQALDAVLLAAERFQATHPMLHFAFLGDGVDVDRLKTIAEGKGLVNVSFFPRVEMTVARSILSCADALLIHLRRDKLGTMGIPSKTQAYLAAGKPIIMAVEGEAADIVRTAKAGVVCTPEDPQSISTAIRTLFAMSRKEREEMGKNGQRYYREFLSFDSGFKKTTEVYDSLSENKKEREEPLLTA